MTFRTLFTTNFVLNSGTKSQEQTLAPPFQMQCQLLIPNLPQSMSSNVTPVRAVGTEQEEFQDPDRRQDQEHRHLHMILLLHTQK